MSDGQVEHGEVRMLIGGELSHSADGAQFANLNPADETVLGYTSDASPADFERAIAAARSAFDNTEWRNDTNCARSVCDSCTRRWSRNERPFGPS